jgi:hypothetical protein
MIIANTILALAGSALSTFIMSILHKWIILNIKSLYDNYICTKVDEVESKGNNLIDKQNEDKKNN